MKLIHLIASVVLFSFSVSSCNNKDEKKPSEIKTPTNTADTIAVADTAAYNPYPQVDLSPMDMAYYPADYPKLKMSDPLIAPPVARVVYSRPHLQGRKLFPAVLKYGEPWRLGANEATELQLYKTVTILGEKVKPGRYIIYCVPQQDKWTIVLNSSIDTWGLIPDSTKDIAHFTVPAIETNHRLEYFSMIFEKTASGAELLMAWENIEARLPFTF